MNEQQSSPGWWIPPTYQWILFLVILLIGVALIYYFPAAEPSNPQPKKKVHKEERIDVQPKLEKDNTEIIITPDFYPQIEKYNLDIIKEKFKLKCSQARMIIPQFPEFPAVIPPVPTNKGTYASIGERYMIEFLEHLFPGHQFIKIRPSWLRNDRTNYPLEVDGYSKELNIGAEYNGIQHYVWPNWTGQSYEEFSQQLYRDSIKPKTFNERKECLIVISYLIPHERIPVAVYCKLLDAVPGINTYI